MSWNNNNKRILVFTTTSKALYKRDLLSLCCRGNNEVIRYSYSKRHLEEQFRRNPKLLEGQLSLVIYAEYLKNDKEYRYHPIRHADIINVESDHDSVSFALKLRHFYFFDASGESDDFIDIFNKIPNKPLTKEQKEKIKLDSFFVFESSYSFKVNSNPNETRDWKNLVKYISRQEDLKDITYFRQAIPVEKGFFNKSPKSINLREFETPPKPISISSGDKHKIVLKVLNGPEADVNAYPTLIANQNISYGGPFVRQDGADIIECTYLVIPNRTFTEAYSPIEIKIVAETKKGSESVKSPWLESFITITPPNFLTWQIVLLFALGFSIPDLTKYLIPNAFKDKPEVSNIIVFCLDLLAPIFLFIASFLGFRKLPIK